MLTMCQCAIRSFWATISDQFSRKNTSVTAILIDKVSEETTTVD